MNKVKFFLATVAMGVSTVAVQAQVVEQKGSKFGPFETNKAKDNWSLGLDAGVTSIFGGPSNNASFWKRLGPTVGLNATKWLNPTVGIRAGVQWSSINGLGIPGNDFNISAQRPDGFFDTNYNKLGVHGDLMYDVLNAFCGYKEDRFYSVIPFIGATLTRSYDDGGEVFGRVGRTAIGLVGGVQNRFRVSDAWDINVEISVANFEADVDRTHVRAKDYTGYGNLTVGAAYRFKKRNYERAQVIDIQPLMTKIGGLEDQNNKLNVENRRLKDMLDAKNNAVEEVVEVECDMTPQLLFFNFNSSQLSNHERMNLNVLSDLIKENGGVFNVVGYADLQTGSREYNEVLAKRRAQAVADVLINKYGVSADQIQVTVGDLANPPFEDKLYNRSVVVMQAQ